MPILDEARIGRPDFREIPDLLDRLSNEMRDEFLRFPESKEALSEIQDLVLRYAG
jgi:hypothetical protein